MLKRGVVIDDRYALGLDRGGESTGGGGAQSNLSKANSELLDVQRIMGQNINKVLERGDNLDLLGNRAAALKANSSKYLKDAKQLSWDMMVRKYAPVAAVSVLALFLFWMRFGLIII